MNTGTNPQWVCKNCGVHHPQEEPAEVMPVVSDRTGLLYPTELFCHTDCYSDFCRREGTPFRPPSPEEVLRYMQMARPVVLPAQVRVRGNGGSVATIRVARVF